LNQIEESYPGVGCHLVVAFVVVVVVVIYFFFFVYLLELQMGFFMVAVVLQ
jgi:hypothetical protein